MSSRQKVDYEKLKAELKANTALIEKLELTPVPIPLD